MRNSATVPLGVLFNAHTEAYKLGNVTTTLARTVPLHGLFDQLVGLKIMEEQLQDATIEGGEGIVVPV